MGTAQQITQQKGSSARVGFTQILRLRSGFLLCWERYTPCRALGDNNEKTI
jgi:hypothetical protein